jgi:DNA-binding transcriptional ArsR family regulator
MDVVLLPKASNADRGPHHKGFTGTVEDGSVTRSAVAIVLACLLACGMVEAAAVEQWLVQAPIRFTGTLGTGLGEAVGTVTNATLVLHIGSGVIMEDRWEGTDVHALRILRGIKGIDLTLIGDISFQAPHGLVLRTDDDPLEMGLEQLGDRIGVKARGPIDVDGPGILRMASGTAAGLNWSEAAGETNEADPELGVANPPLHVQRTIELRVFEGQWLVRARSGCACVPEFHASFPNGQVAVEGRVAAVGWDGSEFALDGARTLRLAPEPADHRLLWLSVDASATAPGIGFAPGWEIFLMGSATALVCWFARRQLGGVVLALYARLSPQRLEEHPLRSRILAQVIADPGASASDLAGALGANVFTVIYHVEVLRRGGLLSAVREGQRLRLFARGSVDVSDRAALGLLHNAAARRVLHSLGRSPTGSLRSFARSLGVSPSTLSWHLGRLIAAGLVEQHQAGGYALTARAQRLVDQRGGGP